LKKSNTTLALTIIIMPYNCTFAQELIPSLPLPELTNQNDDDTLDYSEIMPVFPGGTEAIFKFVAKNFVYPKEAKKKKIEGRVMITFVVDENGKVVDVRPLFPIEKRLGYGLEEEAIRVIQLMPNWEPCKQKGKNVKVRYTMPIICRLK
jgi:protein TonB